MANEQVPSKEQRTRELLLRADLCIDSRQNEDWRVVMNDLVVAIQEELAQCEEYRTEMQNARLSEDRLLRELKAQSTPEPEPCPVAWMRGFTSYRPGEPDDYDVECYYGDAPPDDGLKWTPLYTRPAQPPSADLLEASQRVSAIALGAAGKHAERVVELEAEVSTLREHLAEQNRLLSLNVAEVERLKGTQPAVVPTNELIDTLNSAVATACGHVAQMKSVLDDLENSFDKEIYAEQKKEDFDAPDDREYTVTITAKQWRALSRALSDAPSLTKESVPLATPQQLRRADVLIEGTPHDFGCAAIEAQLDGMQNWYRACNCSKRASQGEGSAP